MFFSNVTEDEVKNLHSIVSSNVKFYRLKKGLSQLELSLTIGLRSSAFLGNAENNTNGKHFNIEHIYKISKALEIDICEFFKPLTETPL